MEAPVKLPVENQAKRLCSKCEQIDWDEPDYETTFEGSIYRDESIYDLISRPFCSFCRLIMHLLSPRGADELIEWAQKHPTATSEPRYDIHIQDYGNKGRWNKDTRAIAVRSDQKGFLEFKGHIYEVGRNSKESEAFHQVEPPDLGSPEVQKEVLLSWIEECEKEHENCRHYKHANRDLSAASIKLIDVRDRKIVDAMSTCRYIALSYVWGNMSLFPSNWREVALPEDPNAFPEYLKQMPQTMQDAVSTVILLGERYLWVDFICIPQNDPQERQRQIQQMDLIYNHAYLTIIAACGSNAGFGLPGIRKGSRSSPRESGNLGSIELIAEPEDTIADHLPSTTYESRGWTFQERMLSLRCLFVTEKMVMFQCQTRSFTEISGEDLNPRLVNPLLYAGVSTVAYEGTSSGQAESQEPITQYEMYTELASDYTRRNLTYRSDMLNAFTGITSSLTRRGGGQFFYGLPEKFFDSGLLWYEVEEREEPDAENTSPASQVEDAFPSWSWASCKGPIMYDLLNIKESRTVHSSNFPILDSPIVYFEVEDDTSIRKIARNMGWPPRSPLEGSDDGNFSVRPTLKSSGILYFNTLLVFFDEFQIDTEAEEPFYTTYGGMGNYTLRDDEGVPCGFLFGMPVPLTEMQLYGPNKKPNSMLAWIQLSSVYLASETLMSTMLQPFLRAAEQPSFATKYTLSNWSVINVMLIRYREGAEDVAERVSVGQMFQRAWDEASPTECFIELA